MGSRMIGPLAQGKEPKRRTLMIVNKLKEATPMNIQNGLCRCLSGSGGSSDGLRAAYTKSMVAVAASNNTECHTALLPSSAVGAVKVQ